MCGKNCCSNTQISQTERQEEDSSALSVKEGVRESEACRCLEMETLCCGSAIAQAVERQDGQARKQLEELNAQLCQQLRELSVEYTTGMPHGFQRESPLVWLVGIILMLGSLVYLVGMMI